MFCPLKLAFALALQLSALGFASACTAAELHVDIHTSDGRALRGQVDGRSDDNHLWIRQNAGPIALSTSTPWQDIQHATADGREIDLETLRTMSTEVAETPAAPFAAAGAAPRATQSPSATAIRTGSSQRVRSIQIVDACLANLDRDTEPDGIVVSVVALDDRRMPVPFRGSLMARLHGERRTARSAAIEFDVMDRWSQTVAPADFINGVASFELRFRGAAPEWQFDLLADAVLEVRLGVHGSGHFAASAPVAIREFNPLRDSRQLVTGSRFAPGEIHAPPVSSAATRPDGRWMPWAWNW